MKLLSASRPVGEKEEGWVTRERALVFVLAAVTVLAFYLCFEMARPFLPALSWALALAVVARPLHEWISVRLSNPDAAAALAVFLVGVLLIVPAIVVGQFLVSEAAHGIERAQADVATGRWREEAERWPWLLPAAQWAEENLDVRGEVPRALQALVGNLTTLLTGSIWAIVQVLLALFALYFFFRDRRTILRGVRALVPLSEETDEVFRRVADTVHATVYGTLLVALLQGALGGLMFWLLGLPAPITWGFVMALLAIVPYLGAFVVWMPAALVLGLQGQWGKALLLTAWGTLVVGLIDNLLYPIFVGQRLRLHTLLAFLAIVGGLAVFGTAGVILGPVILAVTVAIVEIWRRRTADGRTAKDGLNVG